MSTQVWSDPTPPTQGAQSTPAQLVYRWSTMTDEGRHDLATRMLEASERSTKCFLEDHDYVIQRNGDLAMRASIALEMLDNLLRAVALVKVERPDLAPHVGYVPLDSVVEVRDRLATPVYATADARPTE